MQVLKMSRDEYSNCLAGIASPEASKYYAFWMPSHASIDLIKGLKQDTLGLLSLHFLWLRAVAKGLVCPPTSTPPNSKENQNQITSEYHTM